MKLSESKTHELRLLRDTCNALLLSTDESETESYREIIKELAGRFLNINFIHPYIVPSPNLSPFQSIDQHFGVPSPNLKTVEPLVKYYTVPCDTNTGSTSASDQTETIDSLSGVK